MRTKNALPGVLKLVKNIFLTSFQTRPASLGSRLRGLHPAARIISAPSAQKFHSAAWVRLDQLCRAELAQLESHPTCRVRSIFPDVCAAWVRLSQSRCTSLALLEPHPLAAGENDFDFICAVRGANSARLLGSRGFLMYFIIPYQRLSEKASFCVVFFFDKWIKSAYDRIVGLFPQMRKFKGGNTMDTGSRNGADRSSAEPEPHLRLWPL